MVVLWFSFEVMSNFVATLGAITHQAPLSWDFPDKNIHVKVWQKPLQYCKVISLQLIKINGKKKAFLLLYICAFTPFYSLSLTTVLFYLFTN